MRKLARTAVNVSRNIACAVPSISRMACCSDWRAATRSSRWTERNSSRLLSSACSSTASGLTTPMLSEGADDAGRLRFQGVQVEVEEGGAVEELVDGALPLRLHTLDDAPTLRRGLGQLELQAVVLFGGVLERSRDRRGPCARRCRGCPRPPRASPRRRPRPPPARAASRAARHAPPARRPVRRPASRHRRRVG